MPKTEQTYSSNLNQCSKKKRAPVTPPPPPPPRQDAGVQVQQLQTRPLVGSERGELREESREGVPPRPPLRVVCSGAGEHPLQMVTDLLLPRMHLVLH